MRVIRRPLVSLPLAAALGLLAIGSLGVPGSPVAGPAAAQDLYSPPPLVAPDGSAAGVAAGGRGGSGVETEIRAQISPRRHTVLSTEIPGKIVTLGLREGEAFAEGDLLAAIDCAAHEARRDRAAAQEEAARRRLETAGRLDRLSSISRLEVDEARSALAAAQAETALAQVFVARCEIRAPFDGRVVERRAQEHQYVGEGAELLAILDDGALEAEMLVPSRWLRWLAPGQRFVLAVDELGLTIDAEVARIGARVDPVSQSVKVFGRIPQGTPGLVAGMSGVARLAPPDG
ncbi:efflux RND transporter periplasmic adaptor subunit [Salinarimonas rosea]|uniref:efflux RND transporter periplasmic adaptor subunit n=1 Tax=Salinarimonas rosea TaxID=552063 RepID=UPI0004136C35|nr:efflux RND transporter periplasmic adaptor subunit [Salinarimonas rosea]